MDLGVIRFSSDAARVWVFVIRDHFVGHRRLIFRSPGIASVAYCVEDNLPSIGTTSLLYILVVTSILGAVITWAFRIETTGVNLDEIGQKEGEGNQNVAAIAPRSAAK